MKRAHPIILGAIAATSSVLLAYQIAATRILSATASYHAAFGVIALVMLGLAASGTRLYLDRRTAPDARGRTTRALLLGAASLVWATAVVVGASFIALPDHQRLIAAVAAIAGFFPPFFWAGYAVASILTDYAEDVGRVYWADLVGAAVGCALIVPLLDLFTPIGLGLVGAVVLSLCAAAVSWLEADGWRRRATAGLVATVACAGIGFGVPGAIELRHAKHVFERPMWTKWNHFNRVTVYNAPPGGATAAERLREKGFDASIEELADRVGIGWGLSNDYRGPTPEIRYILLDSGAGTPIIEGGLSANLESLAWDVTALGYHAFSTPPQRAFIVGGGGGRDILTAKAFGVDHVDVVELNPAVVDLVEDDMADYSGAPYSAPGVRGFVGEARSVLSRRTERYDLIQLSMVDTWAASASGAMVLTENVLYTREAFDIYREHLTDGGILSISRWYHPETYGELARLLSMVGDSLERGGIDDPDAYVVVGYARGPYGGYASTTLMRTRPFTADDVERLRRISQEKGFTLIWPPRSGEAPEVDVPSLLRGESPGDSTRLELDPATDDRPFFFNTFRPFGSLWAALHDGDWEHVSHATTILLLLLAIAALASRILVMSPLRSQDPTGTEFPRAARVYFACLGLGFLFVELALIQRLTIYLGQPTYALTVVLASLLLFGGIGSFLSSRIVTAEGVRRAAFAIVACIVFVGAIVPAILLETQAWSLGARQALAVAAIAPVGICLGVMYPSGVRLLVEAGRRDSVPWAWAMNGVWGVLASVLGMIVAVTFGYTTLLAFGAAAYLLASWAVTRLK